MEENEKIVFVVREPDNWIAWLWAVSVYLALVDGTIDADQIRLHKDDQMPPEDP